MPKCFFYSFTDIFWAFEGIQMQREQRRINLFNKIEKKIPCICCSATCFFHLILSISQFPLIEIFPFCWNGHTAFYLFIQHLLRAYYMPGAVLSTRKFSQIAECTVLYFSLPPLMNIFLLFLLLQTTLQQISMCVCIALLCASRLNS